MNNIKRFIDRVSLIESRHGKDVVIPIMEARGLRDELTKILIDLTHKKTIPEDNSITQVQVLGGTFK